MSADEASVYDDDFEEKLGTMSPKHATWARLIKEHFIQNKNNKCVDNFFDRVYKHATPDKLNAKYVTDRSLDGKIFDYSFIQVFSMPSGKWKDNQASLCSFFKGNPSPVCLPRSPPILHLLAGVHFAPMTTQQSVGAASNQQATAAAFNPMAFMRQVANQMMAVQQKARPLLLNLMRTRLARPKQSSITTCSNSSCLEEPSISHPQVLSLIRESQSALKQ